VYAWFGWHLHATLSLHPEDLLEQADDSWHAQSNSFYIGSRKIEQLLGTHCCPNTDQPTRRVRIKEFSSLALCATALMHSDWPG
jgi:hypothetical protein